MNGLEGLQNGAEVETSGSSADPTTSNNSTTGAWASGGRRKCQGRKYADEAQKKQKNVLYIKIEKEDDTKKTAFLTQKDILDIFMKLNIKIDDIERCDIHSRHDIKEVHYKDGVDASSYLGPMFVHAGWKIMTSSVKSSVTKVRFRNVPIYIPDEELFHLATFFWEGKRQLCDL